jgi:hypothetical protein
MHEALSTVLSTVTEFFKTSLQGIYKAVDRQVGLSTLLQPIGL